MKIAGSLRERIRGLIGERKPGRLLIRTRFGIHTFFVRFPIDIVILDGRNMVRTFRESLRPNRVFFWNLLYGVVLELPAGEIRKLGIRTGQKLVIFPIRKQSTALSSRQRK